MLKSAIPVDSDWEVDLAGNIAVVPLFGLLQFLEATRVHGVMYVTTPEGRRASCAIADGTFIEAQCAHLRDRDALIAMLAWKTGRFSFSAQHNLPAGSKTMRIPSVVMEAARLEDEFERISDCFPGPQSPLELRDTRREPADELDCNLDVVFAAIASRPRVSAIELEQTLALAPIKIRLAVAWLTSQRLMRSLASLTMPAVVKKQASEQPPRAWYGRLTARFKGGVRVLVASSPHVSAQQITASVAQLAEELEAGPVSMSVAPDGPSLARLRPEAGGLVSLTFLPLRKKHRYLFQTFARTAAIVFVTDGAAPGEIAEWESDAPSKIPRVKLTGEDQDDCLVNAFRRFDRQLMRASRSMRPPPV